MHNELFARAFEQVYQSNLHCKMPRERLIKKKGRTYDNEFSNPDFIQFLDGIFSHSFQTCGKVLRMEQPIKAVRLLTICEGEAKRLHLQIKNFTVLKFSGGRKRRFRLLTQNSAADFHVSCSNRA